MELAPCPFCGTVLTDVAVIQHDRFCFSVACPCGAEGPSGPTKNRAIAYWNGGKTRGVPPQEPTL